MSPVAEKEKQRPARTDERGVLIAGKPTLGIIAIAKKNHIADHRALFRRVDIDLGPASDAGMPTDKRLEAVRKGADDPQLMEVSLDL